MDDPRRDERVRPDRSGPGRLPRAGRTGHFRWRPDTDEIEWSDEMYGIYGMPRDAELTLESIKPLIPETDVHWLQEAAREAATADRPLMFWQRVVRPDGGERYVEVRAWTEGDAVLGTSEDITRSVRSREQRDRLDRQRELVLSATADGIVGLDREGRVTLFNRAAAAILGRDDEVLLGVPMHDLVHRHRGREPHPAAACPFTHGAADGIVRRDRRDYFLRPDSESFEAEYTMVPVADPELHGCVVSFRDVTHRVATDRRLRRTLSEVEALSAQRARLLGEVTVAHEEERTRIAGEIHDDTVQVMNAVALQLERVETQAANGAEVAERLAELRALVRDATGRLRRLLFDLYPPGVDHGLADAIERYGRALSADARFDVVVSSVGTDDLGEQERRLLYRLAQEAISNAAKHAHATSVEVTLDVTPNGAQLVVSDDGIGFVTHPVDPAKPGHLGLRLLRQRTESAGGTLRVRSAPGRGTQVEAWLPRSSVDDITA